METNEKILDLIWHYGQIDGDHHKSWVIDQIVRIIIGNKNKYELWINDYCNGDDGPDTYEWNEGIAP